MLELMTNIPTVAFPSELDTILFEPDDEWTHADVRIECSGNTLLNTRMYPNADADLVLEDMAKLVSDHVKSIPQRFYINVKQYPSLDITEVKTVVVPSAVNISVPAIDFMGDYFLSLAKGEIKTKIGLKDSVSWRATAAQHHIIIRLTYLEPNGTTVTRVLNNTVNVDQDDIEGWEYDAQVLAKPVSYTIDWAAIAHSGSRLIEATVHLDNLLSLKQRFIFVQDSTPAHQVFFLNNFGVMESFNFFGQIEREVKPTRMQSVVNGRMKTLSVESVPTWKASTGIVPDSMHFLMDDLIRSVKVVKPNGTELSITDSDWIFNNSQQSLAEGSVTWRESARSNAFTPYNIGGVFDDTFDPTFD